MNGFKEIAAKQKKTRLFLFAVSIMIGVAIIGQAYLFVKVVDDVFLQGQSFTMVLPYLGGLLLVLFARTFFTYLSGLLGVKMASQAKYNYRKLLLNKYVSNPVHTSLRGQSGEKVSIMMDVVDEVDGYFSKYIPQMIQTTFIPLFIILVVFTQHMNTGIIMLVTAPFIPIFMVVIGIQTKKKSEEQMDKLTAFSGRFLDALQGLVTLKLFGQAKKQQQVIEKSSLGFRDATMEILKTAFISSFMLEVVTMLSIGIIALELAIQLTIYESMSFFTAFFILVLVPEFYTSLKKLGNTFHNGQTSIGASKKIIHELSEVDKGVVWGSLPVLEQSTLPHIRLENLGFSYGKDQFALRNIQAEFPPFGQVAIIGKSGAGKTTLLHAIAGLLVPTEGLITLNDKNLFAYQEEDWFDQLSYISQHPYIFSGTILSNIAIGGHKNASIQAIKRAAEQAGLAEMIESLEEGYHTHVGEGGRGLSGGEKQRLAIARAFLKKPAIILFDEPTIGLDLHTERILQQSIQKLSKHSTVITVAHRLHTIRNADKILILEDGKLIGSGTHEQLLRDVPTYRDMLKVQQGGTVS